MIIRPVTDLRNRYREIESEVADGAPVFLTKNGYGSMVVMSIDSYESLAGGVESALEAADRQAASTTVRHTHAEVFDSIRDGLRTAASPDQAS